VSQEEVTAFAARTLVPEREVRTFAGVQPMSPVMFAIAVLVLVSLAVRGVGWTLTRPVDMTTILYMARFQVPVLLQVGAAVLIGGVGLIVIRLIVFFVQSLALDSLVTTGSYSVQMLCYGVMVSAAVVLFTLCLSTIPRKIIVFPGHLRIKFLAYRSRVIKLDDLQDIATRRGHQVWFKKRNLFRCVPLSWGLVGPGIHLRPYKGLAFYFRTRDTEEMMGVLGGWRGVPVSPASAKRKPGNDRNRAEEEQETADFITSIAPTLFTENEE
jgi:hypothetical protein